MNKNCRYIGKRSCTILKDLYCKKEPNRKCSFYKPAEDKPKDEKEDKECN